MDEYLEISTREFLASLQRMLLTKVDHNNPKLTPNGKFNIMDEVWNYCDGLIPKIEKNAICIHVASVMKSGVKDHLFYVSNPDVFLKMEGTNNEITRSKDNPPIRNANNELLKELAIFSIYMHGTKKGILGVDEELRIAGASLIEYLKKEYRIK